MTVTRDDVLARARAVPMPGTGGSIVDADVVRALTIEGGRVRFLLEVDPAQGPGARADPRRRRGGGRGAARRRRGLGAADRARAGAEAAPPPDLKIGRHPTPQAGPGDGAGRAAHHRGRLRQGRRRQVDGRGEPRGGAGARGQARRPARRRHLRAEPAADDGRQRAAEVAGRQDHPAAARPRRHDDVDRADAEGGRGGDLARARCCRARCSS